MDNTTACTDSATCPCNDNGVCQCDEGYTGDKCNQCLLGFFDNDGNPYYQYSWDGEIPDGQDESGTINPGISFNDEIFFKISLSSIKKLFFM